MSTSQLVSPAGVFEALRLSAPPAGSLSESHHVKLSRSPLLWSQMEVADFVTAWAAVRKAPKSIELALRRLSRVPLRSADDDLIIDLMIAAEALFLTDSGTSELSYRLSIRAGLWLDSTSLKCRVETRNLFATAYRARSIVAHGGTPSQKDLRCGGLEMTLREINDQVLRVLKLSCWKSLEASAQGNWPPNWDELIFRDAPAASTAGLPD